MRELTKDEEVSLAVAAFVRGPSALLEAGLSGDDIAEFLSRPSVIETTAAISAEYRNSDLMLARSRFAAKRSLARLVPESVEVLARALRGSTAARDENGNIMRDVKGRVVYAALGPDEMQFEAATDVLNRMGVGNNTKGDKDVVADDETSVKMFEDQSHVRKALMEQDAAMSHDERTLSRERTRMVIEVLAKHLPTFQKKLGLGAEPDAKEATVVKKSPAVPVKKMFKKKIVPK